MESEGAGGPEGPTFVVHAHFYQPPRENPWTEQVAREPSAAPYHDWNQRITAESYRPNGWARVVDEAGRVVAIFDNYELLSFNVGPTLLSWLERHRSETYRRILEGDAAGRGAIAQAYSHLILPLASERDVRTQVRWGLAEFAHRFGRRAEGMWLPETAVNDDVLAVLAEEGVGFTILAPGQARRVRPPEAAEDADAWVDVAGGSVDTRRVYRWTHPARPDLGVDLLFYDGPLSHAAAFELPTLSSGVLLDRVLAGADGAGGATVTLAADGETFGHHHRYGERLLAHALGIEAPQRGVRIASAATAVRSAKATPRWEAQVRESAWSCAHGVGRWREDCGCSTGGEPGWHQRWRAPLRQALDRLREDAARIFEDAGGAVLRDPWSARDDYIHVVLGAVTRDEFVQRHVIGDAVAAFTLLEAQRYAMAMYTSCGWFFNDVAGLETVQILRYAARVMDLLREVGAEPDERGFLEILDKAESNRPDEGTGRDIWNRSVLPARVDEARLVAHLALRELLERRSIPERLASWDVAVEIHQREDRGRLGLSAGVVALTHRATGRVTRHAYGALLLGGLEVLGATRAARDPVSDVDERAVETLATAFRSGARVTELVRWVAEWFGPTEFDLRSALPDGAEAMVERAAAHLADRFADAYERLYSDNQDVLHQLAAAGYPLPPVLRAPAEHALARRLEAEFLAQQGSLDPADYAGALAVAEEARANGYEIDTPEARAALERLLVAAVDEAIARRGEPAAAAPALAALQVAADLDLHPSLERAQEHVYAAAGDEPLDAALAALAEALGLAPEAITATPSAAGFGG